MDFRKAGEIAKKNPGSTVARDPSGSFVVRCKDGALIGSDGVAPSHVPVAIKKGNKSLQPKNNDVARLSEKQLKNIENNIPKNNGLPWSEEEDKTLSASFSAEISLDDIARRLDRKVSSIIARLEKLGLIGGDTTLVIAPNLSQSSRSPPAIDKQSVSEATKPRKKRAGTVSGEVTAAPVLQPPKASTAKPLKNLDQMPSKTSGKKNIDGVGELVLLPPGRRRTGRDVTKKDHADKIAAVLNDNLGTDVSREDVKTMETVATVVGGLASILGFFWF